MKRRFLAVLLVGFFLVGLAWASSKGTAKEAEELVKKAVALYKSVGQEKAFAEFNDPKGKFVDRDLYIYALNMSGTVLAHGANKALIGKDLYNLKDSAGKQFLKEIIDVAKSKGKGWVEYKWTNPVSKKVEDKVAYFEKVGDVILVCGYYK
ncbi:MAG: cache domain-containing protein [Syntrophales bacterium]|nr:cache domain-containing protein [Syntrophales bacterium]